LITGDLSRSLIRREAGREERVKKTYQSRLRRGQMKAARSSRRKTDDGLVFRPWGRDNKVGLGQSTSKSRNEGLGVGRVCRALQRRWDLPRAVQGFSAARCWLANGREKDRPPKGECTLKGLKS